MEDGQVLILEEPLALEASQSGLMNLAAAVNSQQSGASRQPAGNGVARANGGEAREPATPQAPGGESIRLEDAVRANRKLEKVAEELSLQLHEMVREHASMQQKFAALLILTSALAAWGVVAAVLLAH